MREPLFTRNAPEITQRDLISREIAVRAATLNVEERSVEAVLSTDTPATVFDWRRLEAIQEVLIPEGARFDSQHPLLENHMRYSLDCVLGSIRSIRVEGGVLVGRLYFASGDDAAERAWNKVRQGHINAVSIGYVPTRFEDIDPNTAKTVAGKEYKAGATRLRVTTEYRVREGSLVPIGADQAAKIRADAGLAPVAVSRTESVMNKHLRAFLESLGLRAEATNDEAVAFRNSLGGDIRTRADRIEAGTEPFPPTETRSEGGNGTQNRDGQNGNDGSTIPFNRSQVERDAVRADRERQTQIRSLAGDDTPRDLVERAINEDMTVDQASTLFLRGLREQRQQGTAPFAVHSRNHERECTRDALMAGLAHRSSRNLIDPRASEATRRAQEQLAERGDRYRSYSLVDICREACRLAQARDPDTGSEPHGREAWIRTAMSTPDVAYIFTTNVNARLLQAYAEAPDTTDGWIREADVPDFKENERIGAGKMPGLKKLERGGTADHATTDAKREAYKIARYAEQIVLDEQDIIDDSLEAFGTTPIEMGFAAARLRPDLVYALLLANANLADGNPLFHAATHGNLGSGGSSVLAAAGLKAGIIAMAKQTASVNGEVINLNLAARFLIVNQDLAFTARELIRSTQIIIAGTAGSVTERGNANTIADLDLQLRVDNRLGTAGVKDPNSGTTYTGTATNWFLASDPILGRTVEVGYLSGTGRRPQIRPFKLDKGQWGMGWDIKHDIGAKALGEKGLYKSNGA